MTERVLPRRALAGHEPVAELVAADVSVRRGDRAVLDRVGFRLAGGRAHALVGPNGSGKSTLLHTLAGLVAHAGTISPRAPAALMTTHPGFHRDRTLRQHLRVVARLPHIDRGRLRDLVEELALTTLLDRRPRAMSLGQQRAVSLLAPLASGAPLLLLDEPFLALDAHRVATLEGLVLRAAAAGRVVVVSSHELLPLSRCCTELLALAGGRVTFTGTVEGLVTRSSPGRVLVRTPDPSAFASVVSREWAVTARAEADGRLSVPGRSMADVLGLCHRHGVPLLGVWDEVVTLDAALTSSDLLRTEVAA